MTRIEFLRVILPCGTEVTVEKSFILIVPKLRGILRVRVLLVEHTVELIESLAVRNSRSARRAQAPLADEASTIARLLKHLSHGYILGQQIYLCISANARMPGMLSGHQRASRWSADGAAAIKLCETDTF